MYSFRYHLVTICSIFIALALGLLLGAAIASSELVRSTSDDMIESVLSRYEGLVDENAILERDVQTNSTLVTTLTASWAEGRFDGRTVALVFGNTPDDKSLRTDLASAITEAGGSVVSITVLQQDFGLSNAEIREALQGIVEEVPGEDYQQTLARSLVYEWSYVYTLSSAEPTQEDFDLTRHTFNQVFGDENDSSLDVNGGLTPETAFQTLLFDRYPLTRALLSLGIVSIRTDYTNLENHTDPAAPEEQLAALHIATAWQLPYGVNGIVNGFAPALGDSTSSTQMGIQLALRMQDAAQQGELIYPSWLKVNLPKDTSGDVALPNYHVVLVQPGGETSSMEVIASGNNLSCVTTPTTASGRYSVLALLTGGQAGIYGEDRSTESRFVPLPQDPSGRAAFR